MPEAQIDTRILSLAINIYRFYLTKKIKEKNCSKRKRKNPKTLKCTTMDAKAQNRQLPHDLVEEIFVRLPVKSLFRFRSISKLWRSTIMSRYFGERHCLKRTQNQLGSVSVVKQAWFRNILSPLELQLFFDSEKTRQPNPHDYKLIWTYNSAVSTTLWEIFVFSAETWRYQRPSNIIRW